MEGMKGLLIVLMTVGILVTSSEAALQVGFYNKICPKAEATIAKAVKAKFKTDKTITPALLRLFFHDCFIQGCDGSILINSTSNNSAEKDSPFNVFLRGFDVVDTAKTALEKICPGKVSCADIIALATRDSVVLAGGKNFKVPCGRRDSRVSLSSNGGDIPSPQINVFQATVLFNSKGLSQKDMIVLLGAHTVGVAHCEFFLDRLFRFQGTGRPDPSMDKTLLQELQQVCGGLDPSAVAMDQGKPANTFDKGIYEQLLANRGVLGLDAALVTTDNNTRKVVVALAGPHSTFMNPDFGAALVKLGKVGVLQGKKGEIRKICSKIN